jgi:hypothetical protein
LNLHANPVSVHTVANPSQYTYYTCTALTIQVPILVKRTLTTLQITQFLVGASYAMAHSFVSYSVPVTRIITEAAAPATAAGSEETAVGLLDSIKYLVFGAAAKVSDAPAPGPSEQGAIKTETAYVTQPCITTSGATFAIWLNVIYLAPLTYLFVKFFITSYIRRSSAEPRSRGKARRMSNVVLAEKAGWDAAKDLEREVYGETSDTAAEANGTARPNGSAKRATRARQ